MTDYTARIPGMLVAIAVAVAIPTAAPAFAQPSNPVAPSAPSTDLVIETCPALYALGVQGTGESSPDAAPTTDTGMLSTVFRPMMAAAPQPGLVDRAYVPYESAFGGVDAKSVTPYVDSVAGGLVRLRTMAKQVADRCAATRFAIVGYSQGAHVASMFAQEVGKGSGVIPADRVAAVALFADPTRNPGAPLFPGAPGKQSPDPAPGTDGADMAEVAALPVAPAAGGGIGPERDKAPNFAALTGRVASFCAAGDLACDAPTGSPILRAVANVAGQTTLSGGDPIASLVSISQALAYTSIKTVAAVATQDVQGTTLSNLSISPRESISQRIADASDPRAPLDAAAAVRALLRVGMIGLNAVATVVRTVLSPAAISELATAGLANPAAGMTLLGTKLAGAIPELVPPTTVSRLVNQAYRAVEQNFTDNRELLDLTTWVRYWDTVQRHGAYSTGAAVTNGEAPTRFVADWFAALARDLARSYGTGAVVQGSKRVAGFSGDGTGASATPNSSGTGQFPFGTGAGGAASGGATSNPPTERPGTADNVYPFATN
ncbi:cutinase family protein [Nocardia arizonensis]|uniref:cutinase family protein n=1 Tax=Nocardia arizonensis TaxID=1141647 RepID=UPI0006CFD7CD|nr:cutinase family protein [Nocardia arizonensis]